jgi:hypothetical protein
MAVKLGVSLYEIIASEKKTVRKIFALTPEEVKNDPIVTRFIISPLRY